MKVVTREEMRKIDEYAIEKIGIPGCVLMENAGRGVFELIKKNFKSLVGLNVAIICGPGNNGGDGFVVARHLLNNGASPHVFLLTSRDKVKGDAKLNLDILYKMRIDINEITKDEDVYDVVESFRYFDLIIDAIFGTGFKGSPRGIARTIIQAINESGVPIIAVDVPSGLDSSTGNVEDICVRATWTCTMGLPKRGLILYPGREFAGKIEVIDIGIPRELYANIPVELLEPKRVKFAIPTRKESGHKGDFGRVLIVAGSRGMTGAAKLTSMATLKIGAGLAYLIIPESLNPILETLVTEVITLPVQEKNGALALGAFDAILEYIQKCDVLTIGPGISQNPDTKELVRRILLKVDIPTVIDADGLNNIDIDILKDIKAPKVITPHPGELSRIINIDTQEINRNRIDIVKNVADKIGGCVVLKGAPTVIASHDHKDIYINTTGSSALASGGSGDVLTGMIAGLIAQGADIFDAAIAGVYLHGLAGDIASKYKTKYGVTAQDVLDYVPISIKHLLDESEEFDYQKYLTNFEDN